MDKGLMVGFALWVVVLYWEMFLHAVVLIIFCLLGVPLGFLDWTTDRRREGKHKQFKFYLFHWIYRFLKHGRRFKCDEKRHGLSIQYMIECPSLCMIWFLERENSKTVQSGLRLLLLEFKYNTGETRTRLWHFFYRNFHWSKKNL
jgi:hypothetical protein